MKPMHKVIFTLTYFEDAIPTFSSNEEVEAWYQALGRMLMFAADCHEEGDMLKFVTAHLSKNPLELCAAYHAPIPVTDVKDAYGYPVYYKGDGAKLEEVLGPLIEKADQKRRPFVMAAVQHRDGKVGLHS